MNNDEQMRTILSLLEKAEQILSILNLPDTTINKYNQLKELAFEKLGMDYLPLTNKVKRKPIDNQPNNPLLDKLKHLNRKKSILIEFLFDIIDKLRFEDNNYMKQYLNENNLYRNLEKNISSIQQKHSTAEELEFEFKLEDIKIKDYIGRSEILYKQITNKSNGFKINDDNSLVRDYESKIEELRSSHEREMREYRDRFTELRIKYNPDIENELYNTRNELNEVRFIQEKINELVIPIYEKHFKNASWYEKVVDMKYKELENINFIISLVNKFFSDNKYLIELVNQLEGDKNTLLEERGQPFVINAITKSNLLSQIYDNYKIVEENTDNFHKNFEQIIDYINKNIENL
jgi:hypothetical protein